MYNEHTLSIENRIVNIYQPYVRPIVRGKDKAQVEFGAKLGVSIQNGYAGINTLSWEAYNRNQLLEFWTKILGFQESTGRLCKRFFNYVRWGIWLSTMKSLPDVDLPTIGRDNISEREMLFAVPDVEILKNPNLLPNNPGY